MRLEKELNIIDDLLVGYENGDPMLSVTTLQNKQIVIYGAGGGFNSFSTFILTKYNLEPVLVLDLKFGHEEQFDGIPACHPERINWSDSDKKESIVVITLGSQRKFQVISDYLKRELGFKNVIWAFSIYEYSLHHTSIDCIANVQDYIVKNITKISKAFELLQDDLSREVFKSILATYYYKTLNSIPSRSLDEQYFPKDIQLKKDYTCFIDAGAYTGDTVEQIIKNNLVVDTLFCFEPDEKHFAKLVQKINPDIARQVITVPCGLYHTEKSLNICSSGTNSALSDFGASVIQVVSLDHLIHGIKPTFIKMDIEGSELEALIGSKRLITESQPDLAISAYHKVGHLWELLLFIDSLHVYDRYYLRNYTSYVSETVIYATTS